MVSNGQNMKENAYFIGYQHRLIDIAPSEISFININPKKNSFSIRIGYGKGEKYNLLSEDSFVNYSGALRYNNSTKITNNFEAFFIKPGYIFKYKVKRKRISFHGVNLNLTYSNDQLTVLSIDKLFGEINTTHKKINFYSSIEYEKCHLINLFPKLIFGFNYILGIKIINPTPFDKLISGIDKASSYTPSQGFGNFLYVNASISLMYKL